MGLGMWDACSFSYLKVMGDLDHCISVYWLSPPRFEAIFKRRFGRMFSYGAEDEWKYKSEGINSFKMPTIQHDTLWHNNVMQEGYRLKMLLYTLDKLFYIYDQVKHHRGIDEKFVVAYEILSLSALCCTECQGWMEKSGMPDAMPLVNLNDTCHFECLT